jgi:hypothetical protein
VADEAAVDDEMDDEPEEEEAAEGEEVEDFR